MTRFLTIATTALTLAAAAPAVASPQLARALDVEPGTATLTQLVQLKNAEQDDDRHRARVIREQIAAGAGTASLSTRDAATAGADQLARKLGVTPGAATLSELAQLDAAEQDDQRHRARVIREQIAQGGAAPVDGNAGADQLARKLGIAPGTASLAELARLQAELEDDDRHQAQELRARIGG